MKIRTSHGTKAVRALKTKTALRKSRTDFRILPTRRRRRMMEALDRGRMGMLSRLELR
jgi:hypothetical protein